MNTQSITITSGAFEQGTAIPSRYSCDGEQVNPPLHIEDIPNDTISLALIMEDPDAPGGTFDHWLEWNIDPLTRDIKENSRPGISGKNSAGKTGYHGPCPPKGSHRYYFFVFALDTHIDLPAGASKAELEQAIKGHIIGQGSLMGTYERK